MACSTVDPEGVNDNEGAVFFLITNNGINSDSRQYIITSIPAFQDVVWYSHNNSALFSGNDQSKWFGCLTFHNLCSNQMNVTFRT